MRNRQVRYRAALLMSGLGILTAPIGVWLAHHLPQTLLVVIFCALMLLIAVRMLQQVLPTEAATAARDKKRSTACST